MSAADGKIDGHFGEKVCALRVGGMAPVNGHSQLWEIKGARV